MVEYAQASNCKIFELPGAMEAIVCIDTMSGIAGLVRLIDTGREAPGYSEREQAALAWTEALTRITEGHVPDDVYQQAREQFNEAELANLTLAVISINGWNRLNIAFRTEAGHYKPAAKQQSAGSATR